MARKTNLPCSNFGYDLGRAIADAGRTLAPDFVRWLLRLFPARGSDRACFFLSLTGVASRCDAGTVPPSLIFSGVNRTDGSEDAPAAVPAAALATALPSTRDWIRARCARRARSAAASASIDEGVVRSDILPV